MEQPWVSDPIKEAIADRVLMMNGPLLSRGKYVIVDTRYESIAEILEVPKDNSQTTQGRFVYRKL